jgi:hypothetical protein
MDENLFFNIQDFIKHPLLLEHKLSQPKLVEVLRQSPKFHYENKTGTIKFKEKADRNILIIRKLLKDPDNTDEIKIKEDFLTQLIKENNKSHFHRIKKIDKVGEGFHVVFDHEDVSQNVEKFFNERLKHEGRVLISSIIKEDKFDFIENFLNSEILLAAESLKRRVVSAYDSKVPSMWQQVQRVNEILLNPSKHVQRRYTQGSKVNSGLNFGNKNKNQNYFSQNLNNGNFNTVINNNGNLGNITHNTYSNIQNQNFKNNFQNQNQNFNQNFQNFQNQNFNQNQQFFQSKNNLQPSQPFYSNSMVNTHNRSFIEKMLIFNNNNNNNNNNNPNQNNPNQGFNKFDLVGLKQTFENYRMPEIEDFKPHRHSENPRKPHYRASFAPSLSSLNILEKSLFDRKRMSTFSNLSCEPVIEVPNIKEYDQVNIDESPERNRKWIRLKKKIY